MTRRPRSSISALLLVAGALISMQARAEQPFEKVRSDAEPMISRFNEATGKVRAIFLASPT